VTPRLVGLVADDLTGATDSAVQFAAAGWSAHLLRTAAAAPQSDHGGPTLLAVATGVRAAGDDEAAACTAAAVRSLLARGCNRLYVKVDSTMRGSVAAQLQGALAAWTERHAGSVAVLCPAFPDQGRTVVGGQVLVDGVPVARSPAGVDPVTPVTESRLDRLVPGATAGSLSDLSTPARDGIRPPEATTVQVDASTDADLAAIAATVDRLGPQAVPVGSAGLAAAMAQRWSPGRSCSASSMQPCARVLVGVSSVHPAAIRSVQALRSALADPAGAPRATVDVVTTPEARTDAAAVAVSFGDEVAERLLSRPYDALVLVGGDGAAATLDRVGATAITVHAALAPGVPIGTIVGGAADGVRVVTRSGGFGDAHSLVDVVDRLQSLRPPGKEPS
jgi:D-threonate/D-erythronate kinase